MQQVYHSNAMTNINIRHQIQTSSYSMKIFLYDLECPLKQFLNGKIAISRTIFRLNLIILNTV